MDARHITFTRGDAPRRGSRAARPRDAHGHRLARYAGGFGADSLMLHSWNRLLQPCDVGLARCDAHPTPQGVTAARHNVTKGHTTRRAARPPPDCPPPVSSSLLGLLGLWHSNVNGCFFFRTVGRLPHQALCHRAYDIRAALPPALHRTHTPTPAPYPPTPHACLLHHGHPTTAPPPTYPTTTPANTWLDAPA